MPRIGQRKGFVDRGDPVSWDFVDTDFTTDGDFHDLDLSAIIPKNAKAVLFHAAILSSTVGDFIMFRRYGNVNTGCRSTLRVQVADVYYYQDLIVSVTPDQKVTYFTSIGTITSLILTVGGYWI